MPTDIRSIIVPLTGGQDEEVLDWAARLASNFEAVACGAFVRRDQRLASLIYGPEAGVYIDAAIAEQVKKSGAEAEAAAAKSFAQAKEKAPSRFGDYVVLGDDPHTGLMRAARSYDLAITLLVEDSTLREEILGALLFGSALPVFAAPGEAAVDRPLDKVLLAWDASREAARAMRAAVPFMKRAARVEIVHMDAAVTETDPLHDAALYLKAHEITADRSEFELRNVSAGEALLEHAAAADADLVVMGAYGHPRWMEQAFGGATQDVLRRAAVPVLLAH